MKGQDWHLSSAHIFWQVDTQELNIAAPLTGCYCAESDSKWCWRHLYPRYFGIMFAGAKGGRSDIQHLF